MNFKEIVTGVSTGTTPISRLKFYAKRLARETATRRLATVLMAGLLLFQLVTFLFPPHPSYASSPQDLVPGGPFTRQTLISTVFSGGVQQVFLRLGIDQAALEAAQDSTLCSSEGWLSMGRFSTPNSVEWQPGIWLGPSSERWQQPCFAGLRGIAPTQDSVTGQWYNWGVILDCGNIVLIPVPPPKTISCTRVDIAPPAVLVGQPVTLSGFAHGDNLPSGELVNMAYGAYQSGTNNLVQGPQPSNGIPFDAGGNFSDTSGKTFTFNQPGTYDIRLLVAYNNNGQSVFATGSATGDCQKTLTVNAQPTGIGCASLQLVPPGDAVVGTAAATKKFIGQANTVGATFASSYEYHIDKQVNGQFQNDIAPPIVSQYGARSSNNADDSGKQFTFNPAAIYRVRLVLVANDGSPVSGNGVGACAQQFTIQPITFACQSLSAAPAQGNAPLKDVTFTAQATVSNTTVTGYQFDFGDGSPKQDVVSDKLLATTKHDYNNPGKFTASVIVKTAAGNTQVVNACKVDILTEQSVFKKTVQNNTILTGSGGPTDANNAVARPGDKLTYTLGIANIGASLVKGFVFRDDISDILEYADLVDLGGASKVVEDTRTFLVWPAVDVPVATDPNNPTYVTKTFTVQAKDPLPTTPAKATDPKSYNCSMEDEFHGNIVVTPLSVNPVKRLECSVKSLPQTGSSVGWVVFLMAFFAASSLFLLFRNRLLRRELELVETLTQGAA